MPFPIKYKSKKIFLWHRNHWVSLPLQATIFGSYRRLFYQYIKCAFGKHTIGGCAGFKHDEKGKLYFHQWRECICCGKKEDKKMSRIISFTGKNHFLSNFYMSEVAYEGRVYPSSEHAFVAAKTTDDEIRKHIASLPTPGQAKRYGRNIKLRDNWDEIRINEMRKILENKFGDQELWEKLQNTSPHELIEGNDWGDRFWGQSPLGNGRNELGKLLMALRDDITRIE